MHLIKNRCNQSLRYFKQGSYSIAVIFFALASSVFISTLLYGCGNTNKRNTQSAGVMRESIYGEVLEITGATSEDGKNGIKGWVEIEGARSQVVPSPLVAIDENTRIIDKRSGQDVAVSFDAIAPMQTVEASFKTYRSPPERCIAVEIIICP